ncbi:hydroxymethylglutaryl-CoA lyase [Rhizobium sp. BK313]|uniref:hydroxymethylglutaryl-CoA lyase n=1 Tax=Rhizobium sp. BK313 TaxID=2587081 RepID=UPI00105DA235|nr:hydroxymethylglutaryl-CoA lyase [Rhizobium sp. BK313]MBB3459397.1 hydroxymethylglutaryl-CoA lyase [Rhizobium sp. BK313]
MALPKSVVISEEGPREGFQIEKQLIPTDKKVALIDALSGTGLKYIQTVSFVSPNRVPNMVDADEVVSRIALRPGVEYSAIWFNEMGLQRAVALRDRLTVVGKLRGYASDAFLEKNLNRKPGEHRAHTLNEISRYKELGIPITEASVTAAFGCNFSGDVPVARLLSEIAAIKALVEEYDLPIESVSLADTMAWATPAGIRTAIGAIQDRFPEFGISLHLHDTRGMAIANAYAALEMGIRHFDAAVGGLGGCPFAAHKGAAGNICTEDLVFMCHEMGIETGIDLDALIECGQFAEDVVGHPLPGAVKQGGSLTRLRQMLAK